MFLFFSALPQAETAINALWWSCNWLYQLLAKIPQDLKKYKFIALLLINMKSATLYALPAIT